MAVLLVGGRIVFGSGAHVGLSRREMGGEDIK
jgi:hypothetical protein